MKQGWLAGVAMGLVLAMGWSSAADAQSRTRVTVYTALENDQLQPFKQAIEADVPDVEISWVRDSTGVITSRFLAEKDNPRAGSRARSRRHLAAALREDEPARGIQARRRRCAEARLSRHLRPLYLDRHGRLPRGGLLQHGGSREGKGCSADLVDGSHQARVQGQDRDAASGLVGHGLPQGRGLAADHGRAGRLGLHGQAP